jgi:Flp pilus assembly protein TadB
MHRLPVPLPVLSTLMETLTGGESRYSRACRWVSEKFWGDAERQRELYEKRRKDEFERAKARLSAVEKTFDSAGRKFDKTSYKFRSIKKKYEREKARYNRLEEKYEDDELHKAIRFARLEVEPYEVILFSYFIGVLALVALAAIFALVIIIFGITLIEIILFMFMFIIIPPVAMVSVVNYPLFRANRLRAKTLGRMPEAINYMVMAMRLTPSLDNAIKFASDSVDEPLASNLKKVLWDIYTREYDSIEEAFLAFAYDWGDWNEDFKRALYTIRSSVLEQSEAGLYRALDKANEIILDGTKRKLEDYADKLSVPTMVLFTLGILLPLILAAMLPVLGLGINNLLLIIIIMNVIVPVSTLGYAYYILGHRPGIRAPPNIPNTQSKIERRIIILIALGVGAVLILTGVYVLSLTIIGSLFIIWGIGLSIAIYCKMSTHEQKLEHDRVMQMEDEFPEALFQLGSRIAEGKPIEQALEKTSKTMKRTAISEAFRRISYNLQVTRASLSEVLFGNIGILSRFPSKSISATMHTVVETTKKDAITAGQTIVGISAYLRELKKVEEDMRLRLRSVTNMMSHTALFFAPLVMGVTLVLYVLLSENLAGFLGAGARGVTIGGITAVEPIPPYIFSIVIGLYLIMLVLITIYFCTGVEHGEDWVMCKSSIGSRLPISLAVYSITCIIMQMIFI